VGERAGRHGASELMAGWRWRRTCQSR
jgi:hypothetical protein